MLRAQFHYRKYDQTDQIVKDSIFGKFDLLIGTYAMILFIGKDVLFIFALRL